MRVGLNLWELLRAASAIRFQHRKKKSPDELCAKSPSTYDGRRLTAWYCNLWIDALCINQRHDQERNHEIQQMGRTYQSAAEVIVWLFNDVATTALFDRLKEEK
jgi:hypothetical protein